MDRFLAKNGLYHYECPVCFDRIAMTFVSDWHFCKTCKCRLVPYVERCERPYGRCDACKEGKKCSYKLNTITFKRYGDLVTEKNKLPKKAYFFMRQAEEESGRDAYCGVLMCSEIGVLENLALGYRLFEMPMPGMVEVTKATVSTETKVV